LTYSSDRGSPCPLAALGFELNSNRFLQPPDSLVTALTPVVVVRTSPSGQFSHFRRGCFVCGSRQGPHKVFEQLSYLHIASGYMRGPTYFCLTPIGGIAASGSLVGHLRVARCQR